MLEHPRHTSALTVAQKHNETFLRNITETKKLRELTTHLRNELKTLKAEKSTFSIARRMNSLQLCKIQLSRQRIPDIYNTFAKKSAILC